MAFTPKGGAPVKSTFKPSGGTPVKITSTKIDDDTFVDTKTTQPKGIFSRAMNSVNSILPAIGNAPGIKQLGQAYGAVTGAVGGAIGGAVGAVGTPIVNAIKGRPAFEGLGQQIANTAKGTAGFGYQEGKSAVPAALTLGLGKVPNAILAVGQGYQGVVDLKEGLESGDEEQAIQGGLALATALMAGYGVKENKGLILNKDMTAQVKSFVKSNLPKTPPPGGPSGPIGNMMSKVSDSKLGKAISTGSDIAKESLARAKDLAQVVPERIKVNADAAKVNRASLEALPEPAQNAIKNGVEQRDINTVLDATPEERNIFNQMHGAAEDFAASRGKKDPAEFVGNQIRKNIDALETIRKSQGSQLGEYARELGKNDVASVKEDVLKRLQEVPGLEGLRLTEKSVGEDLLGMDIIDGLGLDDIPDGKNKSGPLDFSDTVLNTTDSKPDRKAIEQAFRDLDGKDGKQLHMMRQSLFETLGGKKKANVQLTGTQENAIDAVREGIADTIEKGSDQYKELNKAYREVIVPLKELRKFYKNLDGASGDVLDQRGATLARRLTSNAQSGAELRYIFDQMEAQLEQYGKKPNVDVQRLQDFMSVLERYYDVTKDTTLANQVKLGVNNSKIADRMLQKVEEVGGLTNEVTRKAFKDFFESVNR